MSTDVSFIYPHDSGLPAHHHHHHQLQHQAPRHQHPLTANASSRPTQRPFATQQQHHDREQATARVNPIESSSRVRIPSAAHQHPHRETKAPRKMESVAQQHQQRQQQATPKPTRTVPRSRHSRSPSPSGGGQDEVRYEPHTTTAQGFPVNNKLKKAKYATSIDERGYLAVYEFQLNEQTIMWDYSSGFVHLTGIWKALGNSKADIVRLVDNHPELEGVIRRIRGGFLKIQGTWVPFELCKRLAVRTCYPIRHALISVFGPEFPEECLKPGTKGYGTLTLDDSAVDRQRKKRKIGATTSTTTLSPSGPLASGNVDRVRAGASAAASQHSANKNHRSGSSTITTSDTPFTTREKRPRLAHTTRPTTTASVLSTESYSPSPSPSLVPSSPPSTAGDSSAPDSTNDDVRGVIAMQSQRDTRRRGASGAKIERTSPPAIPRVVDLQTGGYCPSKPELLDLLRASRSLQRLSAGSDNDWIDEGGQFNIPGTDATFKWDGSDALDLIVVPSTTCRLPRVPADGSPVSSVDGTNDGLGAWDVPPSMTRNFSTNSSVGTNTSHGPLTPPQSHAYLDLSFRSVESAVPVGQKGVVVAHGVGRNTAGDVVGSGQRPMKSPLRTLGIGIDILRSDW